MDKISINNLFPTNNDFKPLDVHSLYNSGEQKIKNKINFNIDKLIKLREGRKNKILQQYEKVFNICLNKINTASNLNKYEIIYDVPDGVFGFFDYNPIECLKYIEKKLNDLKLDTIIFNDKTIYVSCAKLLQDKEKNH